MGTENTWKLICCVTYQKTCLKKKSNIIEKNYGNCNGFCILKENESFLAYSTITNNLTLDMLLHDVDDELLLTLESSYVRPSTL